MSLYPQPNKWTCGPFALKHALVMLGVFVDEKEVSHIAGTHWWTGTDEIKLARAAKAYECELMFVRRKSADRAKRELLLCLKKGYPTLLCVDRWSHWITVVNAERGRFVVLDSQRDPVVWVNSWSELKNRWHYPATDKEDPGSVEHFFDLHILIPKFRVRTKAKFSIARAWHLRRPENRFFAHQWDAYFEDLLHICRPRTPLSEMFISMGEFLRRHGEMVVSEILHRNGEARHGRVDVWKSRLRKTLKNLQFVADTYGLIIHIEDEKRAIAGVTAQLMKSAESEAQNGKQRI
ncbi:MAG: hypothetical protein WBW16_11775 [Bacteroidota bacterium]